MDQIAILTIGNEITDGRVVDSNSAHIAQELRLARLLPLRMASCRDDEAEIVSTLQFLSRDVSAIIVSGGLGPTSDDKTREAAASFAGVELELNENELSHLKEVYCMRGREFEDSNRVQAFLPKNSNPIPNRFGTAPGIDMKLEGPLRIFCLPGVPREMKSMLSESVIPALLASQREKSELQVKAFHLFGIPESVTARKIRERGLPEGVEIGYRPHFPEIEVRLSSFDKSLIHEASQAAREVVSDYLFSDEEIDSLPKRVGRLLRESRKTLSVAESCTSGLLGKLLTDESGASSYFLGGVISYSNELKESLLHVPKEILLEHGAVSHETARAMSEGVLKLSRSDYALSITGVAGPEGGTEEKPVGLFYIGISNGSVTKSFQFQFPSNRDYIRTIAAYSALDTLRRFMLGLPFLGKP